MKCPKCGGTLNKVQVKVRPEYGGTVLNDAEQVSTIELDQCLSCNGIWFDANELEQYLSEKLLILDSPKVPGYKDLNRKEGICPKCNRAMVKIEAPNNAGFQVDICEACKGVWLDSSELDKLEDANLSAGEKHVLVIRHLGRKLKDLFARR